MIKFLIVFTLMLVLIGGASQEMGVALNNRTGNITTPDNPFVHEAERGEGNIREEDDDGTQLEDSVGTGLVHTRPYPPPNQGRDRRRTPSSSIAPIYTPGVVVEPDLREFTGSVETETVGENTVNVEEDSLGTSTRRAGTLHWTWEIDNLDSPNGNATFQTPTLRADHVFDYTGEYRITATPYTRFEQIYRRRITVFYTETVNITITTPGGTQTTETETRSGSYTRTDTTVLSTWTDYDTSRRSVFRAVITQYSLRREIDLPPIEQPRDPPRIRHELTD